MENFHGYSKDHMRKAIVFCLSSKGMPASQIADATGFSVPDIIAIVNFGMNGPGPDATYDDPNALVFDYTRHYAIGWHIKPDAKTFLMLGGGGYSVPKHLLSAKQDATIDVVEIDPGITAAAREFFALRDNGRLRIVHEDARVFLNRAAAENPGGYDMVMGDTFTSSYSIPFHLGTVECAERIKALLRDDGVFVCNIISAVTGEQGKILRSIRAAFAAVFPRTHVFPVSMPGRPDATQNVMLVALKTEKPMPLAWDAAMQAMLAKEYTLPLEQDVVALTDDYAPVERYAMPMLSQ